MGLVIGVGGGVARREAQEKRAEGLMQCTQHKHARCEILCGKGGVVFLRFATGSGSDWRVVLCCGV